MARRFHHSFIRMSRKVAITMSVSLAVVNIAILIPAIQKRMTAIVLEKDLAALRADLTELRRAEQEGFVNLEREVAQAEARLASIDALLPRRGAPFDVYRRGFELARQSGIDMLMLQRGAESSEETGLGRLGKRTFNIHGAGDLTACLKFISKLESVGKNTLTLDEISINPELMDCRFSVIIASRIESGNR